MNPSTNGELLPPIMPETNPLNTGEISPAPISREVLPLPPQGMPVSAPLQSPITPPIVSAVPMPVAPLHATPLIADDADLIEKEWVLKAKQIVAQTRADPYVQSQQVNRMKADYMKKRYNKDIKLEEA